MPSVQNCRARLHLCVCDEILHFSLSNCLLVSGNIEEVSSKLSTLTSKWQDFASAQVRWSVDIIYRLSNVSHESRKSISTTLDTVNKMLFINFEILQQAEIESKSSNRYVSPIFR